MKRYGSQVRETLTEAGYKLDVFDSVDIVKYKLIEGDELTGRNAIVISPDGKLELWTENDDYAGYVLEIEGIGYEFVRTL